MKKQRFSIWKYLTQPSYRVWIDLCARQEYLDRNIALVEQNLKLMSHPLYVYEEGRPRTPLLQ